MTYFRRNLLSVVSKVRQHQFSAEKIVVERAQHTVLAGRQKHVSERCQRIIVAKSHLILHEEGAVTGSPAQEEEFAPRHLTRRKEAFEGVDCESGCLRATP